MRTHGKVFLYTGLLITLLAISITICRTFAYRQSSPEMVEGLPLSDCVLPCFAGATIGHTVIDDAIEQMSKRFEQHGFILDQTLQGANVTFLSWEKTGVITGFPNLVNVTFENNILMEIGLQIDPKDGTMPNLGELTLLLGTPSCVLTDEWKSIFNIYYLNTDYALLARVQTLKIHEMVQLIHIEKSSELNCEDIPALSWQGFADTRYIK